MRCRFLKAEIFQAEIWESFTVLDRLDLSLTDRITALTGQILAKRGVDRAPERNDDLSACGMSSLDMVNLMLAVESEFEVKIPDRDMTPANFRSVARIEALLGGLQQRS